MGKSGPFNTNVGSSIFPQIEVSVLFGSQIVIAQNCWLFNDIQIVCFDVDQRVKSAKKVLEIAIFESQTHGVVLS